MVERLKITKRGVDALKITGKRYYAWDTDVSGFAVRISPTGGKVYAFRYRYGGGRSGRERWISIGNHGALTPEQAREISRKYAAEVASGGDPAASRDINRKAPTVSELLDRYLSEHVDSKNKASTANNIRNQITRYIRPALGSLKVAGVTRADISRFHSGLASTPYAANRALALLSKVFSLAEVWGERPDYSNPCKRIERYKERPRERFLSEKEFATLGAVLVQAEAGPISVQGELKPAFINHQAIIAIRLLIFTGARVSEILAMRWEYINWEAKRSELPDSKSNKKKHIHLPHVALDILRKLDGPENGKGFVIRGKFGDDPEIPLVNIKDPWRLIRKVANLDDVRIHDLRHSFASAAVLGGMSLPILGALMGHLDVKTTNRYAHLSDDPLRNAAEQVGRRISNAVEGKKQGAEIVNIRKNR